MWKWVAEAMKKKIIITIQIENQCKDVFFSFFSCLNLGYLSLFSFFMPVVWVSVIKHAKEKLILAFVSYDSAFHFPADVLHSKKGLLGLLHSAHRTLLTCNCTETSGQLDLKAFWACVWVSFSSRVVLLSSAFQGPLLLWCEKQRTFMSSCFYLNFFFFLLLQLNKQTKKILLASSSKAGEHMSFYFWDGGIREEMEICSFPSQARDALWPACIGSHNWWCTEMIYWKWNASSLL